MNISDNLKDLMTRMAETMAAVGKNNSELSSNDFAHAMQLVKELRKVLHIDCEETVQEALCSGKASVSNVTNIEVLSTDEQQKESIENEVISDDSFIFSKELRQKVADICNGSITPKSLSAKLEECVRNKDKNRCIGTLVNEDLWNGTRGWQTVEASWKMISFIWKNAPDFFCDFDHDREINENKSCWDIKYFNDQRNYLRHDFSLERLCHFIMVYEFLYKEQLTKQENVNRETSRPVITVMKGNSNPFGDDSNIKKTNSSCHSGQKRNLYIGGILLILIVAIFIICFSMSKTKWNQVSSQTESQQETQMDTKGAEDNSKMPIRGRSGSAPQRHIEEIKEEQMDINGRNNSNAVVPTTQQSQMPQNEVPVQGGDVKK